MQTNKPYLAYGAGRSKHVERTDFISDDRLTPTPCANRGGIRDDTKIFWQKQVLKNQWQGVKLGRSTCL